MFHFKQFSIQQDQCAMKVGTDGVLLGAWANFEDARHILDIGAGTGLLSIMAAQRNCQAKITGLEIDLQASIQAQQNSLSSPWKNRICIFHQSIQKFSPSPTKQTFDYIISNPPFFSSTNYLGASNARRTLARGSDQLSHKDLLIHSKRLLNKSGFLGVILPIQEGLVFQEMAINSSWFLRRATKVFPREGKEINRILMEFQGAYTNPEMQTLTIRNKGKRYHDYTSAYIDLVKPFYTIL